MATCARFNAFFIGAPKINTKALDNIFLLSSYIPVLFYKGNIMDWAMDWDLALKRNSEALNAIVATLFAMWGLQGKQLWRGFPVQSTAPCRAFSGPPNPPFAVSLSSRPGALW
jgi:hypothetical protein